MPNREYTDKFRVDQGEKHDFYFSGADLEQCSAVINSGAIAAMVIWKKSVRTRNNKRGCGRKV